MNSPQDGTESRGGFSLGAAAQGFGREARVDLLFAEKYALTAGRFIQDVGAQAWLGIQLALPAEISPRTIKGLRNVAQVAAAAMFIMNLSVASITSSIPASTIHGPPPASEPNFHPEPPSLGSDPSLHPIDISPAAVSPVLPSIQTTTLEKPTLPFVSVSTSDTGIFTDAQDKIQEGITGSVEQDKIDQNLFQEVSQLFAEGHSIQEKDFAGKVFQRNGDTIVLWGLGNSMTASGSFENSSWGKMISDVLQGPEKTTDRIMLCGFNNEGKPFVVARPKSYAPGEPKVVAEMVIQDGKQNKKLGIPLRTTTPYSRSPYNYKWSLKNGAFSEIRGPNTIAVFDTSKGSWHSLNDLDIMDGNLDAFTSEQRIQLVLNNEDAMTTGLRDRNGLREKSFEVIRDGQGKEAMILVKNGEGGAPSGLSEGMQTKVKKAISRLNEIDPKIVGMMSRGGTTIIAGNTGEIFGGRNYAFSFNPSMGSVNVNEGVVDPHISVPDMMASLLMEWRANMKSVRGQDGGLFPFDVGRDPAGGVDKALFVKSWAEGKKGRLTEQELSSIVSLCDQVVAWYRTNT